jgi:hypothetical protein
MSDLSNVPAADIEMWNAGEVDADAKMVRPCRLRINGTEIVIAGDSAPFVHVHDFGGRKQPLLMDIKGILVRSLTIHPSDPTEAGPVVNNIALPLTRSRA